MSLFASAVGSVSLTDTVAGSTTFSKILNNGLVGDLSSVSQSLPIGTTASVIAIPNGLCQFLYIKNVSSTVGSLITITWTPVSLSAVNVLTLDPGAVIIFSQGGGNGITSLSLVSNVSNTPVEFMLVG